MNATRVRIDSRHTESFCAHLGGVERRIDRLDFFLGIVEADVAQLALLVFLSPLRDFFAQQAQFRALLFDGLYELAVGASLGSGAFEFRHSSSSPRTSSPLCRNN